MFLKIGPMQENNEKEFLKCNLVAISLEHCVTVWVTFLHGAHFNNPALLANAVEHF